ncbi:MAG TPA: DNA-directed RNA polymerase subunit beta' [Candidatus Paceibacterota bacterium]
MFKKRESKKFDYISLKIASPERIRAWSFGEVTKPETMNYRTQRSEKNGLFDEKIFGPDRDYECYCGKYRGIRYKGIICEKCGVEITRSIVRRERMGHIELSTPVAHIWFLRNIPSRISLILGIPSADVEKVVYFAGYLITKVNEEEKDRVLRDLDSEFKAKIKNVSDEKTKEAIRELLVSTKNEIEKVKVGKVLDEVHYHKFALKYGTVFEASIGAEAVYQIFKNLDLNKISKGLESSLEKVNAQEREKINKRLGVIKNMIAADIRPEWMFLTALPVIPAALRPMVALDGGRHATSDVNDLYRRVINRNNRLKKLKEINAPEVILRNEKRILQEAVDALIDSSQRHGNAAYAGIGAAQRRVLKSLSDNLKGKRGLFRQNLLGKRVDYSGRSVIVVGPELNLNECGLPKHMALEMFRPFVIAQILKQELAYNIRGASRLIEEGIPEVWAILEDVIKEKYVILNRAPTLHRLGIQAFKPVLIEGSAIRVHPLVCSAFNADFDGDTMAVHIPLSDEAQSEAKNIMSADKNILKPGSGNLIASVDKLDIVLGCFWMTSILPGVQGEGKYFESFASAIAALNFRDVTYRAKILVIAPDAPKFKEFKGKYFETTCGRILFNELLPDDYPFINKEIDKKTMAALMNDLMVRYGIDNLPPILDKIKKFGFKYVTVSGVTWGIDDIQVPLGKGEIIKEAKKRSDGVIEQYNDGLLSEDERIRKNIEIWHEVKSKVEKIVLENLDKEGSVYNMWRSGARGSAAQITQMAGMKGLIQNASGETIELPILSSTKEGFNPIEYFINTHGSRKGLADTALNTAKAGYLTRRLFVAAQDVLIAENDCGTKEGIRLKKETASGMETPLSKSIKGRVLAGDVIDDKSKVLFEKSHLLSDADAEIIEKAGIGEVFVRSPLACKTRDGICAICYGTDLGKNRLIDIGEAVGTVAAQAIGEPGTQLTMRTFHGGGAASVGGDITQGLPRVEEVFEKRKPKTPSVIAHDTGIISDIKDTGKEKIITILPDAGEKPISKKVSKKDSNEYIVPRIRVPLVKIGDKVARGDVITDGSADIDELFKYAGKQKAEEYIISEIKKLYELQGEPVSRKHIEIIVRQMFSRVKIKNSGDTGLIYGDLVEISEFEDENEKARKAKKEEAKGDSVVLGITDVSLSRKSFLSAASFQHTTRVLIQASVEGAKDKLKGLMENVILGRLIPAGSGFKGSSKSDMVEKVRAQAASEYREEFRG